MSYRQKLSRLTAGAVAAALALAVAPAALAASFSYDLGLTAQDVTLSVAAENLLAGQAVRVYVQVHSYGELDGRAHVVLYRGEEVIGQSDAVMVRPGGVGTAWVDWTAVAGPWPLRVQLLGFDGRDEVSANNTASVDGLYVDEDTDADSVPNRRDPDDDNDGLTDEEESQLGTNPLVADTDGDGTADRLDVAPTDATRDEARPEAEGSGRNIFAPPADRSGVTLPVPEVPVISGFTDESSSSLSAAAPAENPFAPPRPPTLPSRTTAPDSWSVGDWLPYVLIVLGGIGFATVSWRRRGVVRTAPTQAAVPVPKVPAAAPVTVKVRAVAVSARPRRRVTPSSPRPPAKPKPIRAKGKAMGQG